MDIFHYHPTTGVYLAAGLADQDPVDVENWLVPAHACLDAPPTAGAHQVVVRVNNVWKLLPDYRGHIYFTADGSRHEIETFNLNLPDGAIETPPPSSGYVWEGGVWVLPSKPPTIVEKVTMRQARLALHTEGLLPQVEVAINALQEPARTAARIEWDYSSEVIRDKPFVALLATALGLDETELDDLFTAASLL